MYLSTFVVGACCRRAITDMYLYLMLMVYYWYVSAFYYWNVFFVKKGIAVRNSNSSHADGVFYPFSVHVLTQSLGPHRFEQTYIGACVCNVPFKYLSFW